MYSQIYLDEYILISYETQFYIRFGYPSSTGCFELNFKGFSGNRSNFILKGEPSRLIEIIRIGLVIKQVLFCAFSACKHNKACREIYERIVVAKGKSNKLIKQAYGITKWATL